VTKLRSVLLLSAFALLLPSCETATNMMFEPAADDPLDGFEGRLSQAGIHTEMDWGPGQNLLLSEHQTVKNENAQLKKDKEELYAENQNLQSMLKQEKEARATEQSERVQLDAEVELQRQRVREREAKILSLQIEKAKLEQDRLRHQIAALNDTMNALSQPQQPAGQPPRQP